MQSKQIQASQMKLRNMLEITGWLSVIEKSEKNNTTNILPVKMLHYL